MDVLTTSGILLLSLLIIASITISSCSSSRERFMEAGDETMVSRGLIDSTVSDTLVRNKLRKMFGHNPDYDVGYVVNVPEGVEDKHAVRLLSTGGIMKHGDARGMHVTQQGHLRLFTADDKSIMFGVHDKNKPDRYNDTVIIDNKAMHVKNLKVHRDLHINKDEQGNPNLFIGGRKVIIEPGTGVLKVVDVIK